MESKHVIVAVPDPHTGGEIAEAFRTMGYHVIPAEDVRLAAEVLAAADAECLVLGLSFPGIDLDVLCRAIDPASAGTVEPVSLDAIERQHIEGVLQQTGGNRSRTARLLGISRSTLHAKIRRYGLEKGKEG